MVENMQVARDNLVIDDRSARDVNMAAMIGYNDNGPL
jgi:hypothetical protein